MLKLAFWGVFTWAVDRKGSQVGMCVNRSNTSSTHLSLLCIFCMWERASGKSPLFFIAASHTILFPSALDQDWGKPFVCVCVYIRPRTSSPQKPQRESLIARRTPDWQAYRTPTLGYATHMTLHTCTCFSTHVGRTFMGKEIHHRGHIKMPRGSAALTLVLNLFLFFFFTASPIVAVERI